MLPPSGYQRGRSIPWGSSPPLSPPAVTLPHSHCHPLPHPSWLPCISIASHFVFTLFIILIAIFFLSLILSSLLTLSSPCFLHPLPPFRSPFTPEMHLSPLNFSSPCSLVLKGYSTACLSPCHHPLLLLTLHPFTKLYSSFTLFSPFSLLMYPSKPPFSLSTLSFHPGITLPFIPAIFHPIFLYIRHPSPGPHTSKTL